MAGSSDHEHVSFERVVARAPCALLVVDAHDRVQYANRHAASLLGCDPDHLDGRPLADLFPADPGALAPGNPRVVHARRCDGEPLPVEVTQARVDGDGTVLAVRPVLGSTVEPELDRWLRLERLVLDTATRLISASGPDLDRQIPAALGQVAAALEADHALLHEAEPGADVMALRAEWVRPGVDPGPDRPRRLRREAFAWSTERVTQGRYHYVGAAEEPPGGTDGQPATPGAGPAAVSVPLGAGDDRIGVLSVRWLRRQPAFAAVTSLLLEMLGTSLLAAVRRLRAEQQIESGRTRFRAALTAAPVGVALLDDGGGVLWANPALADMAGTPPAGLVGSAFSAVCHPHDATRLGQAMAYLAHEPGRTVRLRHRVMGRAGALTWVDTWATHVGPASDGGDSYAVAFVRDVSATVAAEQALQRAYERERAAAEQLRAHDRMKDEFVAVAAHELRTPVTPISGMATLLVDRWATLGDDDKLELLRRIAANADDMRRLVEDLLEFSRLEGDAATITPRPLRLRRAVRALVDRLAPDLARHHVRVEVADDTTVQADPYALDRILANLLSNATKFSPPGTTVTVGAGTEPGAVTVEVRDEGTGIPAEDLAFVFDRFYQGANKRLGRGAGLGLSIVRHYVELHGGTLNVESRPGQGTTMRARLPAPAEHAGADPEAGAGRAALVVDDEPDIRFMLRLMLEDNGWRVREATNGTAALEVVTGPEPPDLVLLDVRMPGLDGWDVVAEMRAAGLLPGLRVVLLTAWAEPAARERALAAGCEDLITKPVTAAHVAALVDR